MGQAGCVCAAGAFFKRSTIFLVLAVWLFSLTTSAGTVLPPLPDVHHEGDRLVAGAGWLATYDGIKVLHLKGTPLEMGIQQGLLLGKEAEELRPYVDPSLQQRTGLDAVAWRFRDFYMDTKLLPVFQRNIPNDYLAEMHGFVYGVTGGKESDIKPVLVGNVAQELSLLMCTSVAVWGSASTDGRLYHARNLDNSLPMAMIGSALVMVVEPEGKLPYITLSYPANFGVLHAMNSKGITVSMNYALTTDASIDGMPFVFLLRQIVESAETLDQALQIIKETPRTIGLSIMVGDAKLPKAVVVEVSANHYAVRETDTGFITATNHYVSDVMEPHNQAGWSNSALRDKRLAEMGKAAEGNLDPEGLAAILRDKFAPGSLPYTGFVRGIESASTMAAVIFDPTRQVMWVGVQDEEAPASDRILPAFSFPAALAGHDPRLPELDIPIQTTVDTYRQDWLQVYQAERAMATGNLAQAQGQLEPLERKYPQAEYILYLLAATHLRQGHDNEADTYFRQLIELPQVAEPRHLQEAMLNLGILADKALRREEALEWYQRVLAVDVPDLGDSERVRQTARVGLEKPLRQAESWLGALWSARVFLPGSSVPLEPSGQVAAISVLGAHRTNPDWVAKWLDISVGDQVDAARLKTMERALLDLGTFSGATVSTIPIGQDLVHLVVRLEEGLGFYKDPVEFAVNTAVGITENNFTWRYDNLFGRAVNVGGTIGWGATQQRSAFVESPVQIGGGVHLRLQAETRQVSTHATIGPYGGTSFTLHRRGGQVNLTKVLDQHWTLGLTGQWFADRLQQVPTAGGYNPPEGSYVLVSTSVNRRQGSIAQGSTHSFAAGVLKDVDNSGQTWLRTTAGYDVKQPISINMQVMASFSAGWMHPDTPLAYQFRLGGSRMLRGYNPTLTTTGYAHATVELRRYLRSDLHAAVFTDAGLLDSGAEGYLSRWSPGLSLRYRTPIGPSVVGTAAYAPDTQKWRFEMGFTTVW